MIKEENFRGTFYPDSKDEVLRYFDHFNKILEDAKLDLKAPFEPKAIISPHAGYIYSGFSANIAYKIASYKEYQRVVIIGPSHRVYLDGASVALYDGYSTPFGEIEVDLEYSKKLISRFKELTFGANAHKEHSTQTQIPFIKHYFPKSKIVEIVYGKIGYQSLAKIIEYILSQKDTLIVISTDLSHFYTQKEANELDSICINAIANKNLDILDMGCEACGMIGLKAILDIAIKQDFNTKVLDYRTSFDASGDDSSVVGYTSAIIG